MSVSGPLTFFLRQRRHSLSLNPRLITQGISACLGMGTLFCDTSASFAQIIPDSSAGSLTSNCIGVAFSCNIFGGHQDGVNLFHSFSDFTIPTSSGAILETNLVSAPSNVENIFIRVVGSPTAIDGAFAVDALFSNGPNIYFLSPLGIRIGSNARLDYPSNFLFSTAEQLRLDNGAVFDATTNAVPLLTLSGLSGLPSSLRLGDFPGVEFLGTGPTAADFLPQAHKHQFAVVLPLMMLRQPS